MEGTRKLGIVLNGGGAKGSYQLGIWKYMREIGLDRHVSVFIGSSVGALNAVLFANGDYYQAESIWTRDGLREEILPSLHIKEIIKRRSILRSRKGLERIIEGVGFSRIRKSNKKVYATCSKLSLGFRKSKKSRIEKKNKPMDERFFSFLYSKCNAIEINSLTEDESTKMLLASSALPFVFPAEKISGTKFRDGGLNDNCPVNPLLEKENCSDIIVIHLNERKDECTYDTPFIHEIFPSHSLGNFFTGTLKFGREKMRRNIALGYNDARTIYAPALSALCRKYEEAAA